MQPMCRLVCTLLTPVVIGGFALWSKPVSAVVREGPAIQDIIAPQVISATIEPPTINTSLGPVTLTLTLQVTDDLSGVRQAYYRFVPANPLVNGQFVDAYTDKSDATCTGSPTDLTCLIPFTLPQYAAGGPWNPSWIATVDMVGNRADFNLEDITPGRPWYAGFTNDTEGAGPPPVRRYLPALHTPPPPPEPEPYFARAILQRCDPNAGVTYVNGTVYEDGRPVNGYTVVFSYAPDGPVVAGVTAGPHAGYEGWAAGFYSHILSASGPRQGDWYFWIVGDSGKRISAIGPVHTDGEAGEGMCQQAILDFDTADYRLTQIRLWDVVENGGRVDDSGAIVCGEGRTLEVRVLDVAGRLLNGVAVQALYGAQERYVTGEQGKGDGIAAFVLGRSQAVSVARDAEGRAVTSDRADGISTDPAMIPMDQLIAARYCDDAVSCAAFVALSGCRGHYSWTVIFQREY